MSSSSSERGGVHHVRTRSSDSSTPSPTSSSKNSTIFSHSNNSKEQQQQKQQQQQNNGETILIINKAGTNTNSRGQMRKSASMLQFSEHAINQVQGLSKRGLELPVTPRLQRRRYRGIFCMSFILSVLFYLYLSAIVAAHNKHRKVLPYIGSETKHIYKEGEGFFSRVMFGKKKRRGTNGGGNGSGGDGDGIDRVSLSSSHPHHARHHDEHDREDMELELENEDSNVARMFYHH
ncbi:unnamed protein product [Bathycoccus prasinos]